MCAPIASFWEQEIVRKAFRMSNFPIRQEHTEKEGASGRTGCAKAGGNLRFYGSETVLRAVLSYMRLRIAATSLRLMSFVG